MVKKLTELFDSEKLFKKEDIQKNSMGNTIVIYPVDSAGKKHKLDIYTEYLPLKDCSVEIKKIFRGLYDSNKPLLKKIRVQSVTFAVDDDLDLKNFNDRKLSSSIFSQIKYFIIDLIAPFTLFEFFAVDDEPSRLNGYKMFTFALEKGNSNLKSIQTRFENLGYFFVATSDFADQLIKSLPDPYKGEMSRVSRKPQEPAPVKAPVVSPITATGRPSLIPLPSQRESIIKLKELFDSKLDIEWHPGSDKDTQAAFFEVGNRIYVFRAIASQKKNIGFEYLKKDKSFKIPEQVKVWKIGFTYIDKEVFPDTTMEEIRNTSIEDMSLLIDKNYISGDGNPATVITAIVDIIKVLHQNNPDDIISFKGTGEKSRTKVYSMLIRTTKRFAPDCIGKSYDDVYFVVPEKYGVK